MTPDLERAERLAAKMQSLYDGLRGASYGSALIAHQKYAEAADALLAVQALRACIEASRRENWDGPVGEENEFHIDGNGFEFFQSALTVQE